jgi:hypothetical protein
MEDSLWQNKSYDGQQSPKCCSAVLTTVATMELGDLRKLVDCKGKLFCQSEKRFLSLLCET